MAKIQIDTTTGFETNLLELNKIRISKGLKPLKKIHVFRELLSTIFGAPGLATIPRELKNKLLTNEY